MMKDTQFDKGILEKIAREEHVQVNTLENGLRDGSIVILKNHDRSDYMGIGDRGIPGEALTTKINVNVGLSSASPSINRILESVGGLQEMAPGRLTIMDLSSYAVDGKDDFTTSRRAIMEATGVPVGTVPIYEAVHHSRKKSGNQMDVNLDGKLMIEMAEKQAEEGVSFMVAHVGINKATHEVLMRQARPVVSKGGGLTNAYIATSGRENPFVERFDDLLAILEKHNVVLNIGSALRSGSTIYNDMAQIAELESAAEFARYANKRGVQAVIEGPGHIPLAGLQYLAKLAREKDGREIVTEYRGIKIDGIADFVKLQRTITGPRPYFTLGPLPSDNTVRRDGTSGAIGAAIGTQNGLSWLCYISDMEHVGMPQEKHVRRGFEDFLVAAKVGDLAKGQPKELYANFENAQRGCLDVNDRRVARKIDYCSICSREYCPIELNPGLQPINELLVINDVPR